MKCRCTFAVECPDCGPEHLVCEPHGCSGCPMTLAEAQSRHDAPPERRYAEGHAREWERWAAKARASAEGAV